MQKIGFAICILLLFAGVASAQIPTSGNVFFGYSYLSTDLSSSGRANTNGWEASVEGKIFPFIGIVGDFDAHYGSQNFPVCSVIPVGTLPGLALALAPASPSTTICSDLECRCQ